MEYKARREIDIERIKKHKKEIYQQINIEEEKIKTGDTREIEEARIKLEQLEKELNDLYIEEEYYLETRQLRAMGLYPPATKKPKKLSD